MVYISKDCALLKTDNKNYKQKLSFDLQGTLHNPFTKQKYVIYVSSTWKFLFMSNKYQLIKMNQK